MEIFFHLPTLLVIALGLVELRRRPTLKSWLQTGAIVATVGSMSLVAALHAHPFALMRSGSWFLFVYLPTFTAAGALAIRGEAPRLARLLAVLVSVAVATGAWAFFIEPRWLEITRYSVTSAKLERPLRVAVISDLQTDHVGAYERRAIAAVMNETPDLVLMPGDYLQIQDPAARRQEAEKLRAIFKDLQFSAPLGVLAVRGDVEVEDWHSIFAGTGVQTFEKTTRLELDDLVLTALSPRDARLRRAWPRRTEKFHITFGHAPEFALDQEQLDKPSADLLIAGHTHGGQVRLPFIGPLVTFSSVPRSWAAGRTDFDNQGILIVSRGVGMERGKAPRLRFLCRPEIVIIDLQP